MFVLGPVLILASGGERVKWVGVFLPMTLGGERVQVITSIHMVVGSERVKIVRALGITATVNEIVKVKGCQETKEC